MLNLYLKASFAEDYPYSQFPLIMLYIFFYRIYLVMPLYNCLFLILRIMSVFSSIPVDYKFTSAGIFVMFIKKPLNIQ